MCVEKYIGGVRHNALGETVKRTGFSQLTVFGFWAYAIRICPVSLSFKIEGKAHNLFQFM